MKREVKCNKCNYITKDNNVDIFVCKKCMSITKLQRKWNNIWLVCTIFGFIVLGIAYWEYLATFLIGFLLGSLIWFLTRREDKR